MKETGLVAANILLPKTRDLTSFACVACDQFTSEKEYWLALENSVKGKATALDLVLPEVYLGSDQEERTEKINHNIKEYLAREEFLELPSGFVLTVRSTPYRARRIGIVGAVDLEKYEYSKKSSALVRSTEGTIEERIPPRLAIRKNADVELPHIMILYDDEKREIAEKLYENRNRYEKLYDFELNMGGGHSEGWFVPESEGLAEKFSALLNEERLIKKYGKKDEFAFAVGDGNHSLATAKAHWNEVKKTLSPEEIKTHPARFALAEFNNIYDEGIYFEPIHRLVTGVDGKRFVDGLKSVDGRFGVLYGEDLSVTGEGSLPQSIKNADEYIKEYISVNGGAVDYVHGEKNLSDLVKKDKSAVGITFEKLKKEDLFPYVSSYGALPRKTFSMGEGVEKRYYLEAKRITRN